MDLFFTITYYLFIIHLVRVIIYWLHLWQIKEYRLDRLLVHVRETKQGRDILFGIEPLVKLAIIILYFYSIFNAPLYAIVPIAVFSIYLYEALKLVLDIIQKKVKFPVFTPKLILIGIITIAIIFGLLLFPLLDKFFWLVFVDKFVLFIVAGLMGFFSFPSMFYKDTQINKAITKLRKYKKVKVIGITGSYGKGSTKEYMHTIVSSKLNTLKTPSTHNTPIGIARTILSGLHKKTEVFIVEMGAYKIGDIEEMCDFVQPTIGVLTAVNDQHVSLFGSIENTKKAKYELIESLPNSGIALFNGNNDITQYLFTQTKKKKKYLYYVGDKNIHDAYIFAHKVKVHPTYLTFDVKMGNEVYKNLRLDLIGPHHIQNVLPGIFVAQHFNISAALISESLRTIKPLYKTMEPFTSSENNMLLIDDTYNANPASVLSAVEYLSHQKGKKALVLQPMIELGSNGKHDHYEVAKEIGKVCDYLFLTNKNFNAEIQRGISESGNTCTVILGSPKTISNKIKKELGSKDIIVFEGKESQAVLDLLPHVPVYSGNKS